MAYHETPERREARLAQQAAMQARMAQFAAYQATRLPPLSFGDALGSLYIQNAQTFGVTLEDTIDGLEQLARFVEPGRAGIAAERDVNTGGGQ